MTARVPVTIRLAEPGLEKIDSLGERSDVIRRLLAKALANDQIVRAVRAEMRHEPSQL